MSSDKKLIHTVRGKHNTYDIYAYPKFIGGKEYVIFKNGERWKGAYDDQRKAIEVAEREG